MTQIEGYNVPYLANGLESIGDLNVGGATQVVIDQVVEGEIREESPREIQVEGTENIDFNPFPLAPNPM